MTLCQNFQRRHIGEVVSTCILRMMDECQTHIDEEGKEFRFSPFTPKKHHSLWYIVGEGMFVSLFRWSLSSCCVWGLKSTTFLFFHSWMTSDGRKITSWDEKKMERQETLSWWKTTKVSLQVLAPSQLTKSEGERAPLSPKSGKKKRILSLFHSQSNTKRSHERVEWVSSGNTQQISKRDDDDDLPLSSLFSPWHLVRENLTWEEKETVF